MEIDNYRNFLAIVEAGSMTSASEFVHIAQPALSKQLKSLEGYFGTKLIITTRGSKHLILTDAGKILYHKAKYICSLEDMARIEIDDISDGNRGTLRISAANSRSSIFIKTCLEPFHDLFPNVVYEIYEGSVNEQSQQLLSGITELGILSVPLIHQNDFEILFQREEDICAIFSKNSKFLTDIGDKETVSIKDLASLPLCASAGCNLIMNKIFKAHNLKPNILSICTTRTAALQRCSEDQSRRPACFPVINLGGEPESIQHGRHTENSRRKARRKFIKTEIGKRQCQFPIKKDRLVIPVMSINPRRHPVPGQHHFPGGKRIIGFRRVRHGSQLVSRKKQQSKDRRQKQIRMAFHFFLHRFHFPSCSLCMCLVRLNYITQQ